MSINYLRNHGSEIFLSVSEGNPIIVDDKTATLLTEDFETLVENCLKYHSLTSSRFNQYLELTNLDNLGSVRVAFHHPDTNFIYT